MACRNFLWESVRARHVIFGTLSFVSIANLNRDANMATNVDSNMLSLMGSRRTVVGKDHVLLQSPYNGVKNLCFKVRRSIQREKGKLGSNRTVKFSKGTWHHIKKIGKEKVPREV